MLTVRLEKHHYTYSDDHYYCKFYGNNQELLSNLDRFLTLKQNQNFLSVNAINELYNKKLEELKKLYNNIVNEINQLKQQHKMPLVFYKQNYKKVKQLKAKLDTISNSYNLLESKKEDPYKAKPSEIDLYCSYTVFIENNNFALTSSNISGNSEIDIYTFFGNEKDLLITVKNEINNLKMEEELLTKHKLEQSELFLKENDIDKLLKQEVETEIEK